MEYIFISDKIKVALATFICYNVHIDQMRILEMNNLTLKLKAICSCVWFGIMPYWVYENECHYDNYLSHLVFNLKYMFKWILNDIDESDIKFMSTTFVWVK